MVKCHFNSAVLQLSDCTVCLALSILSGKVLIISPVSPGPDQLVNRAELRYSFIRYRNKWSK